MSRCAIVTRPRLRPAAASATPSQQAPGDPPRGPAYALQVLHSRRVAPDGVDRGRAGARRTALAAAEQPAAAEHSGELAVRPHPALLDSLLDPDVRDRGIVVAG